VNIGPNNQLYEFNSRKGQQGELATGKKQIKSKEIQLSKGDIRQ